MSKFRMDIDPKTTIGELVPLCEDQDLVIEVSGGKAELVQPNNSLLPPPSTREILEALGWLPATPSE